jgi:hypothetical protein
MLRVSLLSENDRWQKTLTLGVLLSLSGFLMIACGNRIATKSPDTSSVGTAQAGSDQITEITLERTFSVCTDCPAYKIILTKESANSDKSIVVVVSDLKTNLSRQGTLNEATFRQLCRLIDRERYFELSDAYGEGVMDSVEVTSSVLKNGVRKTIVNRAEKGPIELWGIEMAIEGAVASASLQKPQ